MDTITLTYDQLKELLGFAHSYGRCQQFNYSLFGPDATQAQPFAEHKAIEYCLNVANNIITSKPIKS